MTRIPIRALLTAVVSSACGLPPAPAARGTEGIDVPLRPYVGQLVSVDAVADGDTVRMIFDTGGGETVISPTIARRLGCTPTGRSVGFRMSGERVEFTGCPDVTLSIAGVAFDHESIGVWDVQAALPEGLPSVDGVLSLKTLAGRPFTLSLAQRRLTLETAATFSERTADMSRLTSRIATGTDGDELTVFVRATEPDTGWFLIDSANLDAVQTGPHLRGRPDSLTSETWEASLVLEGLDGVATTLRTADIIYDGALSEEFLRQWVLAFDLSANAVWAAPAPADIPRFVSCDLARVEHGVAGDCRGLPGIPVGLALRPGEDDVLWRGTMEISGRSTEADVFLYEYRDGPTPVLRTPFGWFLPDPLDLDADPPRLAWSTDAEAPPSITDLAIVDLAIDDILTEENLWDRADDRVCTRTDATFSLYCAMAEAVRRVTGEYRHRQPALQFVRRVVGRRWSDRIVDHRLMDFNNDPATTFDEVVAALTDARSDIIREMR